MEAQDGQFSPYTVFFSIAFMVWMLVDAWKRRAPLHWYFIITVMPFGAVFYFVVVKLKDFRENLGKPAAGPPTGRALGATTSASATSASADRGLNEADALEAREQYLDAEPLYREHLEREPDSKRALHGLARCFVGLGRAKEALPLFEKLLELDREFANYGAALDYADALWAADQRRDTIELLEALARTTGRINHQLALGHYLAEFGQVERAKHQIEQALAQASGPAGPFNERHRQWVARGRQMLAELYERYPESPKEED